MIMCSIV